MKNLLLIYLLIFISVDLSTAQDFVKYQYDKDLLPKEFHKGRRDALREKMPANSVAVFFSSPVRNRANDVDFQYHQYPNMYYLSGLREPHAALVVFKENQTLNGISSNEFIFVQDRDPDMETWNGRRLGTEGTKQVLGFTGALVNEDFVNLDLDWNKFEKIFVRYPKGIVEEKKEKGDLHKMVEKLKTSVTATDKVDAVAYSRMMAELRQAATAALRQVSLRSTAPVCC